MTSGNEPGSWGKDAVLECASARGRVCEVLDTETPREQTRSTFLTNVPGRHLCDGWRLVFPQISPYQLCYLFHILQIGSPEPTGFGSSVTNLFPLP
jgi:hypothetical protein